MKVNKSKVTSILSSLGETKLIAATKYVGVDELYELEKLGVKYFGENRVQAFLEKYEKYNGNGEFHIIGTLQPNKVKYVIDKVSLIHSVDSYSLIKEIEKQAAKHNIIMNILVQINIANEISKHGFKVEEVDDVFEALKNCPHIKVKGLMMMAPNIPANETAVYFEKTQKILEWLVARYPNYELTELSMGMSNDYLIAKKYGTTMVRIGSALFE